MRVLLIVARRLVPRPETLIVFWIASVETLPDNMNGALREKVWTDKIVVKVVMVIIIAKEMERSIVVESYQRLPHATQLITRADQQLLLTLILGQIEVTLTGLMLGWRIFHQNLAIHLTQRRREMLIQAVVVIWKHRLRLALLQVVCTLPADMLKVVLFQE
jgi:hypothetical protein